MTFTVNIEAVHACLSSLGLLNVVDSSVFYNELEQQAAKCKADQPIPAPPPLTPSRWITALPRIFSLGIYFCTVFNFHSAEPVKIERRPSTSSTTTERGPGPDPKTMKYRRFIIEETRAMLDREAERLKHTLPIDAPITSPLLSYDQLRLICFSSITIFSLTREQNQVFKDSWCTWDFQAPYMCILTDDSLDENVKEGMDESASFPMDLVYV